MKIDKYLITKMDCPSEEQMIRMKLSEENSIKELQFDIPGRTLHVIHDGNTESITKQIDSLNFDSRLVDSSDWTGTISKENKENALHQRKLLFSVLAINFFFFVLEMVYGFISRSMGLVADSLDMLADAVVYGLALWAVGSRLSRKKKVATLSGYFQLLLALLGFFEVVRRFLSPSEAPEYAEMITISLFALTGNGASLIILNKSKDNEAHIQASKIFTSNDVIANIGVIVAGFIVYLTDSLYPDLIIGALVFWLVLRGAIRILKL